MKGLLLALSALLALCGAAGAQQPVVTLPTPATSARGNASATIVATGVFQKVWSATSQGTSGPAAAGARKGCTIQNNGTHTMYVTEGLGMAASTTSNAAQLPAGQVYYCNTGGMTLIGEIDISGTSGDAFYAAQF